MNSQQSLMDEVQRLRNEQESMQRMLAATLNELHETRCHQHRTQNTVEKIMGFLTSVLQTSKNPAACNSLCEYTARLHPDLQAHNSVARCCFNQRNQQWLADAAQTASTILTDSASTGDPCDGKLTGCVTHTHPRYYADTVHRPAVPDGSCDCCFHCFN